MAARSYRNVLPPLSAQDFADLAARRRSASAGLQDAMVRRQRDAGRTNLDFKQALKELGAEFDTQRDTMMADYGDQGLAFQPRFAGRGLRSMRTAEAQETGKLQTERADRLAALNELVAEARRKRDNEFAQIEAEKVRRRTDLNRLFPGLI